MSLYALYGALALGLLASLVTGLRLPLLITTPALGVGTYLLATRGVRITFGLLRELDEKNRELREALTEIEAMQRAAIQQEKLSSLGLLSAGIAHEINNPMSYILANVQAVREVLEELPENVRQGEIQEFIDDALPATLDGIRRVNSIVADLKRFSRGDSQGLVPYSLTEQVQTALRICKGQVSRTCTTSVELAPACSDALGRPQQLVQVFINLLVNAAEAQPAGKQGTVFVTSGSDDSHVWVSIRDTGCGMSDEVRAKPFFTTKGVGKGTGLGLTVSRGIVEAHHGTIEVQTKLGEGSTFTVRLPKNPEGQPAQQAA